MDIHTSQDDAEALEQRRETLRAFVAEITAIAVRLDPPTTYIEADRAVRALTVADRAVQAFAPGLDPEPEDDDDDDRDSDPAPTETPSETSTLRQDIRACADRVMSAALLIPKPEVFLEVERAQRYALSAGRLLTQLYVAKPIAPAKQPGASRSSHSDDEDTQGQYDDYPTAYGPLPPNNTLEEWRALFAWKIDGARARTAMKSGVWHSGKPYDPADPFAECLYPDYRVPDFNPRSRLYEPDGDLKVMRDMVSEEIWDAYLARIHGAPPETRATPPPPKPEPPPDFGPSIRRL